MSQQHASVFEGQVMNQQIKIECWYIVRLECAESNEFMYPSPIIIFASTSVLFQAPAKLVKPTGTLVPLVCLIVRQRKYIWLPELWLVVSVSFRIWFSKLSAEICSIILGSILFWGTSLLQFPIQAKKMCREHSSSRTLWNCKMSP